MHKNGTIIIVADLGELKAYRVTVTQGVDPHESMQVSHVNPMNTEKTAAHLELITDRDYVSAHHRIVEEMSDKPGRVGGAKTGEPHNTLLEKDRRSVEAVATDINALIAGEAPEAWYLAFPKETNNQLTELLDAGTVKSLAKNVPQDLTKTPKEALLSHFE